jgi:acid phosphatase (class A)
MSIKQLLLITAVTVLPVFSQAPRSIPYVTADQLDVAVLLPNPPASDSPEGHADLAEVHRLQETRTPAQIAAAKADDAEEDIFIFKTVLGDTFNPQALPQTAILSTHVHGNEGVILNPAKQFFRRRRPFNVDRTVEPVCRTNANIDDYGYPSGHSTSGWLEALVLIQIIPEKRDAILARAADYAHNRVVCGVHYPTDTLASKSVAYAMLGLMMNNPDFKKELAAAGAETRSALGL